MADNHLLAPIPAAAVHLCIDMQNMFAPGAPWAAPWMSRVLPAIESICERFPDRTVFTRFITPSAPSDMPGTWRRYYRRWEEMTRPRLDPELLELVPALARFVPPATMVDKTRYSAFAEPALLAHLHLRGASTLLVTGSETDVCVSSTILSAVDLGFRVIVVTDAICSSSDAGHDALLTVYSNRFSEQIETVNVQTLLSSWQAQ